MKIRIERHIRRGIGRRNWAAIGLSVALAAAATPAEAADSGSITADVNVTFSAPPVRSLTVTPSVIPPPTYTSCGSDGSVLKVPTDNIACSWPDGAKVLIQNGPDLPSRIVISASAFVPNTGTGTWELGTVSGTDVATVTSWRLNASITGSPICDTVVADSCGPTGAAPGATGEDTGFFVHAPTHSTNTTATTWSHTITWTALAPS